MIQIRKYIKFGFLLLVPAYFAILANSVHNRHTHITPDGIIITHAHPFTKNTNGEPQTNHRHSAKEFHFLQSYCVDFYEVSNNSVCFCNFSFQPDNQCLYINADVENPFLLDLSQRAPPVM